MQSFLKIILFLCALALTSCAMSMQQGEAWLASKTDAPGLNVTGTWMCPEFSMVQFSQDGRDIKGAFYSGGMIKGAVSGETVSMLIYDAGTVVYIAELTAVDKQTLKGKYVRAVPGITSWADWGDTSRPINLLRMPDQK